MKIITYMNYKQFKNKIFNIQKILKPRFLIVFVLVIATFNFCSSRILPRDIFLVYAADIDTNELVNLVNSERIARGLSLLTIDSRLVAAAHAKGNDMINKDYWSHYGPNGESPWDFIIGAGYDYTYAGENLAKDFSSTIPIHSAWMASPSHKSNIINGNFMNIGIAQVTGEFQGKETTIVVQMFGTTQVQYSEVDLSHNDDMELPETGHENELEAPVIVEPKDGDILDTGAFDVRGIIQEGESVNIFDNYELIGQLQGISSEFSFHNFENYYEGSHEIYAKAYDSRGNESDDSNIVNVTVDTIVPLIIKESVRFEYSEIGVDFENFIFTIEVDDNPTIVRGEYKGKEVNFNYINERWQCVIMENSSDFGGLTISASDAAGNTTETSFTNGEILGLVKEVDTGKQLESGVSKWVVEDIFARIFTRSLRGRINFVITFVMIILLSLERLMLAKTGLTKEKSTSLLHLPVFAILLFVGLLGGGGEIL